MAMIVDAVKAQSAEVMKVFGSNVLHARERRCLSFTKLADCANYNRQYLSALELGKKDCRLSTAVKIARALDVPFHVLFSRSFDAYEGLPSEMKRGFREDDFLLVFSTNVKKRLDYICKRELYLYSQTGMDAATVSRILNQRVADPQVSSLAAIAVGLSVEMSDLLVRSEERRNGQ